MDPSRITRPKEVTIAVKLLCLLMATGFIQFILNASMLSKMAPPAFIGVTVSAFLGIGILLTYMIWKGLLYNFNQSGAARSVNRSTGYESLSS